MNNNDNEGHPGYTIDQIGGQAQNSLPERPNVVLVMAGTNDIVQTCALSTAPTRLGNLIDLVLSDCPDAAVIVASLTPLLDATREANRETYNQAIPGVIASRANAGKHVLLANMSAVTTSTLSTVDGIHPNDAGYVLMANAWYAAITQAGSNGWIKPPVSGATIPAAHNGTGGTAGGGASGSGAVCSALPTWQPPVTIALGVGGSDGPFVQAWYLAKGVALGVPQAVSDIFPSGGGGFSPDWLPSVQIANGIPNPGGIIFADINGDGRDDYLLLSGNGTVTAWLNTGKFPQSTSLGVIAYGVGADRANIRFADVDCDGFADYLVIANKTVKAYLNLGVSSFPKWGNGTVVFSNTALNSSTVRFADLDGDGCADYILVDPTTGAAQAGLNNHKFGSNSIGTIAGSVGSPGSAIAFADINGDGRADFLSVGTGGSIHAWLNKGVSSFPAWDDIGLLAVGELQSGQNLTFAKLNPTAYTDLRADYLTIDQKTGAVQAWMNHGYGDTIGAGVRFADLDGDGKADYMYLTQDGHVRALLNTGNFPIWTDLGIVASGFSSRSVIFADVNCDGRADYLLVNDTTGAVTAYYNLGVSSFPAWGAPIQIALGVGTPGSWITFADIDGDGCADYLTVDPATGAINAWLNTGNFPVWNQVGLLATGVGYPGSAVRLVDINGDGRADYVILKEDGSALVYTNVPGSGIVPAWGSSPVGLAYGVRASRDNVIFGDINGDGKADYLVVNPKTGGVDAYINQGSGGTSQAGNGVQFADLNGDGKSDFLWLDLDGSVHGYLNKGPGSWPDWTIQGKSGHGDGATRQNVVFADVNCDGYDDYLVINKFGGVTAYYNTKNFPNWGTPVNIASGVGTNREAIRIHDVDGDGCADYLVVAPNGQVTAYLNLGPSHFPQWAPPVLIATGVGAPRENIRFADVNGDGLADYLIVDPVNGSVHAFISKGPKANPPWTYNDAGIIAYGVGVGGHAVIFADVNGDKLADYLKVDPATAAVTAWLNPCQAPAGSGSGASGSVSTTSTTTSSTMVITTAPTPTCTHYDQDPGQLVFIDYCVCSGSTFPAPYASTSGTSANSCPYSTMPTQTFNPKSPPSTITANCQVCTFVGVNQAICTTETSCTPTPKPTQVTPQPRVCQLNGGDGTANYQAAGSEQTQDQPAPLPPYLELEFVGGALLYQTSACNTIKLSGSCNVPASESLLEHDVVWAEQFNPFGGYQFCTATYGGTTYNGTPSSSQTIAFGFTEMDWECSIQFPCNYAIPVNQAGYAPGVCGLHISQYQMNTVANPNGFYIIDVRINDADRRILTNETHLNAAAPGSILTVLPHPLSITLSNNPNGVNNDAMPIVFDYDTQHWDSSQSPQCTMGAYDHGVRQGDCTFSCP